MHKQRLIVFSFDERLKRYVTNAININIYLSFGAVTSSDEGFSPASTPSPNLSVLGDHGISTSEPLKSKWQNEKCNPF